mgnify:CR=1 FL=1|jgi:hypothetical protein
MRIIVVAGFYRTGSTWLFNAVKTTIREAGYSTAQQGAFAEFDEEADFGIYKVHGYHHPTRVRADAIFVSHRPMADCLASFERFYKQPLDDASRVTISQASELWKRFADRTFHFDGILKQKQKVIEDIKTTLSLEVDTSQVLAKLAEIKPPTDKNYDPESFYFARHITSK